MGDSVTMEISKAYVLAVDAALELREEGVNIKITPNTSEHPPEEGGLCRDKWIRIEFFVETAAQAQAIKKRVDELDWRGIRFDTSGHPGQRQWDLDFSFQATGVPNGEWQADGDDVEDMIDGQDA